MSTDLFETAARKKYRFPTTKGILAAEDLFDMPLVASNGFCLNNVALSLHSELMATATTSFVETQPVPGRADLETRLEIVKRVIAIKQDAAKAALAVVEKAAKRRKILDIIEAKRDQELSAASLEDLQKQLAELG